MNGHNKKIVYSVLDTETTGFDPETGDRIVEIGIVQLDENRKPTGLEFHEYVDPEREVPLAAERVHGNNREMLIEQGNGQKFRDVAGRLYEFIKGTQLVIHNAAFDTKFLDFEFKLCGLPPVDQFCDVFCTLKFANVKNPKQRNNLDALCKRYGIDNSHREHHGALLDAKILCDVFVSLTREQHVLELSGVSDKPQDLKRLVERLPVTVDLPVYSGEFDENEEHEKIMKRIVKESGGLNLWQ